MLGQYQEAVSRAQGLRGGAKVSANVKHAGRFRWENRQKYSPLMANYDGYSSDASADVGKFIVHPIIEHLIYTDTFLSFQIYYVKLLKQS